MRIESINIATPRLIKWRGKDVQTGIFKQAVDHPVLLSSEGVQDDHVSDREFHGSPEMAAYLYSADCYPFWKEKYPELDWEFGMFGENFTISGLNEEDHYYGDTYECGESIIQFAQPRQPCFKLGVKFGSQGIIKEFVNAPHPGIYIRVLKSGIVTKGDTLKLIDRPENGLSVLKFWTVLFDANRSSKDVDLILADEFLSEESKDSLRRKLDRNE